MRLGESMRQHVTKSLELDGLAGVVCKHSRPPKQTCWLPDENNITSKTRSRMSVEQFPASDTSLTLNKPFSFHRSKERKH